jgi:succinate dehydrogenase / fumarate reductase, cytochrome b subunit
MRAKSPVFLNLFQIRFPITALVSISHRITGVLLFLCIPIVLFWLDVSLKDEAGFQQAQTFFSCACVRFFVFLVMALLLFHWLAGMRHLLLDVDIGISKQRVRFTSWLIFVIAIAGFLIMLITGL